NGTVLVEKTVVDLPAATWGRHVWAQVGLPQLAQTGTATADLIQRNEYQLRLHSASLRLESTIQIRSDLAALRLQGTGEWCSNRVDLQAEFVRAGWLPNKTTLQAPRFEFPAEAARLQGYHSISGSVTSLWEGGRFVVD